MSTEPGEQIRGRSCAPSSLTFHAFLQHGEAVGDLGLQLVDLERSAEEGEPIRTLVSPASEPAGGALPTPDALVKSKNGIKVETRSQRWLTA